MEVEKIPCRIQTVTGIGAATCSRAVFFHVETSSPSQVPVRSGNSFRPKPEISSKRRAKLHWRPRRSQSKLSLRPARSASAPRVHCQSIVRQLLLLPKREQLPYHRL